MPTVHAVSLLWLNVTVDPVPRGNFPHAGVDLPSQQSVSGNLCLDIRPYG
jgi:hypothetical protein